MLPAYLANLGFDYDVFFSYRRLDNEAIAGAKPVIDFADDVKVALAEELSQAIHCHWDEEDPNNPVRGDFRKRAEKSAIFVMFKSPRYFQSEYCRGEIAAFLGKAPRSCVFSVVRRPTLSTISHGGGHGDGAQASQFLDRAARESFFFEKDTLHGVFDTYSLWDDKLGDTLPRGDLAYRKLVRDLAKRVANEMRRIANGQRPSTATNPPEPDDNCPSTIYLAEPSDDLWSKEYWECRHYFKSRGIRVLPETFYPDAEVNYPDFLKDQLKEADVFVQLLGRDGGRKLGDGKSIVEWQSEIALEAKKNKLGGGLKIRRWGNPELDDRSVKNAGDAYRTFLTNTKKKVIGIDQFNDKVCRLKLKKDESQKPPAPREGLFACFEDADKNAVVTCFANPGDVPESATDNSTSNSAHSPLRRHQPIHFNISSAAEGERSYIEYLQQRAKAARNVIFFQASASDQWLQSNLDYYFKALGEMDGASSGPQTVVCKAPPQLAASLPGLYGYIESHLCKRGFDAEEIAELLERKAS